MNSGHPNARSFVPGSWAAPLRARKHHFFRDGGSHALCGAYAARDVRPSEFGTAAEEPRCPTCERKLGYWMEQS